MRKFKNGIPEWPRYEQYTDGFSDDWLLRVIFLVIYMVSIVPRVRFIPTIWTVSFGIFGFVAASECVKAWVHNVRERRRWRREVGTLVTWEQVRELTKCDVTEWVLLGNLKKRGYIGWGHNWRGGWDAVALQNRRTGAFVAVRENTWDVATGKGDAWRIPTHEGGEVSESEVDELLSRLRDPEKRYEAQCRLGRVSARATTLVPALLALLYDEDEDVRGAAVGALGKVGPLAKSAVPALLRIVAEGTRWREEAVRSLGLMGPEAREAVPDLVRWILDGDNRDLRCAAVDALAQMKPRANAIPAFVHVFRAPALRSKIERARHALLHMGDVARRAIPPLEALARDEAADSETRDHAAQIVEALRWPQRR